MTIYAEKLLPHNIEAEESLIGSILIDGDCITRLAPILKPMDFYRERNALCYEAAVALANRDQAVDQTTLAGELARTEKLELVGGMAYLSHLVAITPTSVHAEDYAEIVTRTSTLRRIIAAAAKISEIGYSEPADIDAAIRQAEDAIYSVRDTKQRGDFRSFRELMDQFLEDQANTADPLTADAPLMTGFADLDGLLGGIQRERHGHPWRQTVRRQIHPGPEHGDERRQGRPDRRDLLLGDDGRPAGAPGAGRGDRH